MGATLDDVTGPLVDCLSVAEVFRVWEALGARDWSYDVVAHVSSRMGLKARRSTTMHTLGVRMRDTRRCYTCGARTTSRVCRAGRLKFLCGTCAQTQLVGRLQIRDAFRGRGVAKALIAKLHVARRTRTGAYLYWKDELPDAPQ